MWARSATAAATRVLQPLRSTHRSNVEAGAVVSFDVLGWWNHLFRDVILIYPTDVTQKQTSRDSRITTSCRRPTENRKTPPVISLVALILLSTSCSPNDRVRQEGNATQGNGSKATAQKISGDSAGQTFPPGNFSEPLDSQHLRGNSLTAVGQSELCWRFDGATVEITFNGSPLPAGVVANVLADESTPMKVVAS